MSQFPQALYRMPGQERHELGLVTTAVVHDADQLAAHLADGWHETAESAKATFDAAQPAPAQASDDDTNPPTRAELEAKAADLGLKFDGRTSDKKLGEAIAATLKA